MAVTPPTKRTKLGISHRTLCSMIVWLSLQLLIVRGEGNSKGDSPPVDQSVSFQIEEGQRAGTEVGVIPIRQGLRYRFSEPPTEFSLDPDTGTIITTTVLDRESLSDDVFDLFVQSTPSAKHIVEVKITVLDINDNSPTFRQPVVQILFPETAKPGTQVILDTATDRDAGQNGITTKYRLVSGNKLGRFRLARDVSMPFLYLENTKELDREEKAFYQLRMSVQDGGTPPRYGYLSINITVQDYNDNPPLFDQSDYSSSVNETAPAGTSIIQVHATDMDIGANADITYSVINDDYNQFTVAPKTGVVSSLKKLYCYRPCDGSVASCTANSCMVTLEARDNGGPTPLTGRAYLTVNLVDENDHSPVIKFQYYPSGSNARVDEGAPESTFVAMVSVTDLDTGLNGQTTLRIVKGNEKQHFKLQSYITYYIVQVTGGLDRERIGRYNLTFEATDGGMPSHSSTAYLIIVVNDINDHSPVFQHHSYAAELSELIPVGSFVAGITATDSDTGINAQITYTISSGNRHGYFKINSETGLVTTAKLLDREAESHIIMTILAKDGAARPQQVYTNLTVDVWDENDETPTFDKTTFSVSVTEGHIERIDIITVTATDNDEGRNGTVRYKFDSEVERKYPNVFHLNPVSGKINTLQKLDREEHISFKLKLWALDQGAVPLSSYVTIYVRVLDVNDNVPVVYPINYYATMTENEPSGTSVIQVTASDPDAGRNGTVQYAIVDTEKEQRKFTIDANTGWIMTNGRLEEATYTLIISVKDLGKPVLQAGSLATVHIRVGKTMTAVEFSQPHGYSFTIIEDGQGVSKVGENVGQVQTEGTTGAVSYAIVDGDKRGTFEINTQTGMIRRVTLIDREDTPMFYLSIVVQNNGIFGSVVVNITIDDINDNTPMFASDKVEVYAVENWPVGHNVYLARAEDKDIGNNARVIYTITNGLLPIFDIEQETGMLYLARTLTEVTNTTFVGHVIARDSGTPSRSSEIRITVKAQPSNIHTPVFEYANYLVSVNESQPINDDVYHVVATDVDRGVNGQVTYRLVGGNDNVKFGIFPNGVLYIANALDRETQDWYILKVEAKDKGTPSRSSTVDITISVTDANDNVPVFANQTYVMFLEEGSTAKTFIGMVSASDADIGQNAEILYSFEGTDNRFAINSKTGAITSERSFNREELIGLTSQDYITLVVVARDFGEQPKEDKASVEIHITDVNDNAPLFTRSVYEASISESAQINTEVLVVLAKDRDSGPNSKVSYFLHGGNNKQTFAIDRDTGKVTVMKRLDRETISVYTLVVMAIDGGVTPLNSTAHIKITILDDNDNAPQFVETQRIFDISEDKHIEYLITQLSATDADLGINATVAYGVAGNTGAMFRIDSDSGKLFLTGFLDYEARRHYKLNITATDLGIPARSNSITITVNVIDVNDNAPKFSTIPVLQRVTEGAGIGTSVVTVMATDLDSGLNGRLTYSIIKQEPADHTFSIDRESGKISTAGELDRERVDNYRLVVMATDSAQPLAARKSVQKMVTIIVTDVNDKVPEFVSMDSVTVPLDAPIDYLVTVVKAIDLDDGENGEIEYGIVTGDPFSVDSSSGSIYLRSTLTSNVLSYELTVRAQDKGSKDSLGQKKSFFVLTVFMKSTDDSGPRFSESHYSGQIYENKPAGTSVLTVHASFVQKPEASIEYRITGITSNGDAQRRYFQIHPTSGVISTTEVLDRETGYEVFELEVFTLEMGSNAPHTRATLVKVTLLDRNDSPPTFKETSYDLHVAENVNPGHVVSTLLAEDPDKDSSVQYSIKDGTEGKFSIDPVKGALTVVSRLDRETKASYDITVAASDGIQSSTVTVNVQVTDINDDVPTFGQPEYWFQVSEGAQLGSNVGLVSAYDRDLGRNADMTYSLMSHWGRDKFSLHPRTGVITLIGVLDYEQIHHYILTVKVQDSGATPLSSTVSVYVNVLDENDNAPIFDPGTYSDEVLENATIGTSILAVTATDIDSGDNAQVKYQIINGDDHGQFEINPDTGVIHVSGRLDRESLSYYNLAVRAVDQSDTHQLSTTVMVNVIVSDVNDIAPEFVSFMEITVKEDMTVGTSVFKVIAKDADQGHNSEIQYSIHSGSPFAVGSNSGILTVSRALDRENVDKYVVDVTATDKGHPRLSTTKRLVIHIGDANDNTPVINPSVYTATLYEDTAVGKTVLSISATDADIGLNAELQYMIVGGDDDAYFYLDAYSGVLSVGRRLDYERKTSYVLKVRVQDFGVPPRGGFAEVRVTIIDVNDCAPVFVDSPYVAYVQENIALLPVFVMRVTAKDDDSPPYSQVTYSISSVDGERSVFHINSTTGVIMATKTFDRETLARYQLVITGSDSDHPRLLGSSTITVIVTDVNDHAPVFQQSRYTATVRENLTPPAKVVQVTASDMDEGDNSNIRYSLIGNVAERFTINSQTGEIQTTESLDREMLSEYHLVVVATDSGMIPLSSSVEVIINVEDVNDNVLMFKQHDYRIPVRNPTEQGAFLLGVMATDRDDTAIGQVQYRASGDSASSVIVDSKTGIVTAKSRLSSDTSSSLSFTVEATNENWNGAIAETNVRLSFLPANTRDFPKFSTSQQNFRIAETAKIGQLVTTVTATSPKPSATISYHIAGGNVDESFMVTDSGEVRVHNMLDYERTQNFVLYIESRDDDSSPLATFTYLNIVIEDENDNTPVFVTSYFNTSVLEDEFSPLEVTTVSAEDADSGENGKIKYRFVSGNDKDAFVIDEHSGKITTSVTLDREDQSHYVLIIAAVDQGIPQKTATASVDVHVLDKNDRPPVFTQYFNSKLPENSPVGTFVVRVTSTDHDISPNDRHTYSLASNPGGKFAIDPESGNVTVAAPLDREAEDEYILRVAANDGAYNAETSLAIDVLDINDNAPVFEKLMYQFDFVASYPVGTLIGKVSATDRDAIGVNSAVFYRLVTPSHVTRLNATTGELFLTAVIHFADMELLPTNTLSLTVAAIDRGSPPMSGQATVTVVIQPANEHTPVFEKDTYSTAVMDHSAAGTSVIQFSASDADKVGPNAEVQYSQVGNISQYFSVDASTGWLTVTRSLIGVQQIEYTLKIKAQDGGDPPKHAIVSVHLQVAPMNLHMPQFHGTGLSFQVTIPEDKPVGTTIAGVTADDDDDGPNGQVSYYITGGNTEGLFSIDKSKGFLTIAKPLDYETATEHRLNVTARDKGVIPRQTTRGFMVHLTDINDNAPVFLQDVYDADVVENSASGTTVLQLSAADADTPPNAVIQYDLADSVETGSKFSINHDTGMLHCQGRLDYEIQSEYKVVVKAVNPDTSLTGTTTVLVHVTGVNEYIPQFTEEEYIFVVSESAKPGYKAGAVLATDADEGEEGKVLYYLVGDSNMKGFQIGRRTGFITIVDSIDRETTSEIILEVLAKNRGPIRGNDTARCRVLVKVRDANDPPQFTQSVFEDTVKEDSAHGTQVLRLSAIDNDLKADFNRFTYRILAGNLGSAFKVNPTSGWILVNGALDREKIEMYNLTVAAVDNGHPPKTGTAVVKIHLGDVNDNGPHFDPSIPVGHVTENQEPMSNIVINLVTYTKDRDLVPNTRPYKYRLLDNTDLFVVGETSGLVQSRKSLDREAVAKYQVKLRVTDGGKPTMTSTLTMAVAIDDVNDNPSRPRALRVMVYAYNGRVDSGKIADVRPQDDDIVGNYQCKISSGDQSKFSIPQSCDLHVTALHSMETFTLGVSGSDGRHTVVDYRTTIQFNKFDHSGIDKGIAIHIPGVTASEFLANSFTAFTQVLRKTLPKDQKLLLFSIAELPPSGTKLMLAVKTASGNYLERHLVAQIFTDNQQDIEHKSGMRIAVINYNPCAVEACLNGGECSYKMSVGDAMTIIDSTTLVFSSTTITGSMHCMCPDGFVGSRCERQMTGCNIDGCSNGGTCCREADGSYQCYCQPSWKGPLCTVDINECTDTAPCQNGATCINTDGAYRCQCPPGYTGRNCEYTIEYCKTSPCESKVSTVAPHLCKCKYGNDGEHCEGNIRSFSPVSYIEYSIALATERNRIIIEFATVKRNALLFFYPASSEEYIALEIVNGTVRFSYGLGAGDRNSLTLPKVINDGLWHRLEADRNGNVGTLQVTDCTEDGTTCSTCDSNDSSCYQLTYGKFQNLNTERTLFTVGGVKDFSSLLQHKGRVSNHDFVGCMRNVQLGDTELLTVSSTSEDRISRTCHRTGSSLCAENTCASGATCIDDWESFRCHCHSGFTGLLCEKEVDGGFSFGANALVKYKQKESYRRDQLLLVTRHRRKRALLSAARPNVMLRFRTNEKEGILFSATSGVDSYTLIHLTDGQIWYQTGRSSSTDRILALDSQVSDGEWHSVRLTVTGDDVTLQVDEAAVTSKSLIPTPHQPLALDVVYLSIGGSDLDVEVDGHIITGFSGCIEDFQIDGEHQPLDGATDRFTIESRGEVASSCKQIPAIVSKGSTQFAVIIICTFFATIFIIILATFVVLYMRRRNKERQAAAFAKQNGADKTGGDNRSHQDSGFTEGGDFTEEGILQQHMTNELYNEREVGERLSRPDIIVPESVPVVLADGQVVIENGGVDNDGYLSEVPEHYDIDNTSSIAPSDLVDVVSHYRHYRSGMLPASSRHRKHTHRHTPSPSTMLLSRQSPSHLDPILQRHSPAVVTPSPLTIGNVSKLGKVKPMKVQPPQQTDPVISRVSSPHRLLTSPHQPNPTSHRSTPLSCIGTLYPSNMSSSTAPSFSDVATMPNGRVDSRPNSRLKQPISQLGYRVTPTLGLTVEEVDRLNARHEASPIMTLDVASSSSSSNENAGKDNINRTDFTHADLLNPAAAMPPESSTSSESANDSFTCSEFEDTAAKSHGTEIPTGRVLPQVIRANDDDSDRVDTDSNNCASSCIFTPQDDDTSKAPGHLPDDALSWDYLLNWGPNFQKLVGVFTDIAELPDVTLCNKLPLPPKMCSPRLKTQSPRPRSPAPPPRKQATSPLMHPHDRVSDMPQSHRHSTDSPQFGSRPSSRQSTQSPSRFLKTASPALSSTPTPCLSSDVINEHIKEEYV